MNIDMNGDHMAAPTNQPVAAPALQSPAHSWPGPVSAPVAPAGSEPVSAPVAPTGSNPGSGAPTGEPIGWFSDGDRVQHRTWTIAGRPQTGTVRLFPDAQPGEAAGEVRWDDCFVADELALVEDDITKIGGTHGGR